MLFSQPVFNTSRELTPIASGAACIAGMILTTDCVVSDLPDENEGGGGMPGGMGGMM